MSAPTPSAHTASAVAVASAPVSTRSPAGSPAQAPASPPVDDVPPPWDEDEEHASPDDAQAPDSQLTGADVVKQMLGGTVIES